MICSLEISFLMRRQVRENKKRERERGGGGKRRESNHISHLFISTDTVGMIDFEYGGPNFLAYDIANHFCEFAGSCNYLYFWIH
jgi:hypothetical protein